MRVRILLAGSVAACAIPALALAGPKAMHPELSAKLVGSVEIPKGSPKGHGIVNFTLDAAKGTVCWHFEGIGGIDKPVVAHIHKGPAGKVGPVLVPLGGTYKAKGCTSAAKKTVEAIESDPNAYYANIHTAKYPNGAIRGQLHAGD